MTNRKTSRAKATPEEAGSDPAVSEEVAGQGEDIGAEHVDAAPADDVAANAPGVVDDVEAAGASATEDAETDAAEDASSFDVADDLSEAADINVVETDAADGQPDVFALHDRPGPEETRALIDHLRTASTDAPLVLDAAAVETTGTPYVLALAALARSRAEAGAPAVLANPSAAGVDAFSDLGLFQDLMKMEFRP